MSDWALVRNNVIENVIVVDNGELPAGVAPFDPEAYVADPDNEWQRAVDLDALSQARRPGIGWIYVQGAGYVPPEELTADPVEIPPDGVTASTVTYVDHRPNPPASIVATVNGLEQTVHLTGGRGQLKVASKTAGDHIAVDVGSIAVAVSVTQ